MRLFKTTAFFINLLKETFNDITAFLTMLVLLCLGIANVTYILSLYSTTDEREHDRSFPEHLPEIEWLNSIIYTYITGLGEFDTDGLKGEHKWLKWIIFFMTTFIL